MVALPTLFSGFVATFQTVLVVLLTLPLPFKYRKSILKLLLESPVFAKIIYGLKISAVFILILAADAGNTVVRLSIRDDRLGKPNTQTLDAGDAGTPANLDRNARMLLAERNFILSGTTLFLAYLLWRIFELNLDNIRLEEKIARSEGRDLGTPIKESREAFKELQSAQAPDFQLKAQEGETITRRNVAVDNKDAPEKPER